MRELEIIGLKGIFFVDQDGVRVDPQTVSKDPYTGKRRCVGFSSWNSSWRPFKEKPSEKEPYLGKNR